METPKESYSIVPSEKNCVLINEVKKFPALYDTANPDYYVLAERNKAWLQVAENCNVPAEHCHLRWKSLRKRYAKERRKFKEILNGQRRPWALFPKMSFLASSVVRGRMKALGKRRRPVQKKGAIEQPPSEDDMLILDDDDQIVRTCKVEKPDEEEYIYEHLDDPDSALEILKNKSIPAEKQTAIRSGTLPPSALATRSVSSGRIRRLTPKMANSLIAKKLKQAQQVLNHMSTIDVKSIVQSTKAISSDSANSSKTQQPNVANKKTVQFSGISDTEDKTPILDQSNTLPNNQDKKVSIPGSPEALPTDTKGSTTPEKGWPMKVIKLKGRNPIIFSPEELPKYQSYLKSDESPRLEKPSESPSAAAPLIKIKSVDNLNNNNVTSSPMLNNDNSEKNNFDIIHSLGLMRKQPVQKTTNREQSGVRHHWRAYSWNKGNPKKPKQTSLRPERTQPDSQTRDYEIEETWNDIKQENMDDFGNWSPYQESSSCNLAGDRTVQNSTERRLDINDAKLNLILLQQRLMEDQHRKQLEYMKKEHDLKMTLLKAEIDLKRKQLNIML